jgi:phosphate-selective porin OprO/OprP
MLTRSLSIRAVCGLALVALLALPGAAAAQDDQTFKWSNGFQLESKEKGYKLKFGGRIMADYTWASGDSAFDDVLVDGFEFRRARLFFEGKVYHKVIFKAQYDFAGGDAAIKDLFVGLETKAGDLKFGHFHEPFSMEEITSSKYIAFIERSMPIEAFSPSRNSGVGIVGGGDKTNWGFGYYYEADDFGVSESEDRMNLTGRFGVRPVYANDGRNLLHLGIGVSSKDRGAEDTFRFRTRPEAHFTGRLIDTGSFDADGALLTGLELAGVNGRFWYAGEYITMDVDSPVLGDPTFDGYYAQVGIYLTDDYRRFKPGDGAFDRQKPSTTYGKDGKGAMEIAVRFSNVNLNDGDVLGGEQDNVTVAFNWYLNQATRFMLNWVNADVADVGSADFVLMRWQVDF